MKVGEVGMKEYIVQAIEQETIDSFDAHNAPELIRCKDCKNRTDSLRCPLELLKKQLEYTKVFTYGIPDDWFCADGQRK